MDNEMEAGGMNPKPLVSWTKCWSRGWLWADMGRSGSGFNQYTADKTCCEELQDLYAT